MKKVVIIQARLGSSRLPGKVLLKLGEETVLSHVLDRCKRISDIDLVCCAISDDHESDVVAAEAEKLGVCVVRGSEHDVLNRYYIAAKETDADIILRVTSDCPLIDPEVCADVIAQFERTTADYACNNLPPSWPHGLDCEVMKFEHLENANRDAKKPSEREHVTPYIRNNIDIVKVNLTCPIQGVAGQRWTLDTPQDYKFFQELFKRTDNTCGKMTWKEILNSMDSDLECINTGQDRYEGLNKSLLEDKKSGF